MAFFSNFLPTSALDIVAILDADGEQILVGGAAGVLPAFLGGQIKAQPMKAYVNRDSKGFSHPLESNKTLIDHRIILPIEIQMKLIIAADKTSEIYDELEGLFTRADTVQVRTKAKTFINLYISAIPHAETPEKFNSLEVDVRFSEIQVSSNITDSPNLFNPANDFQDDTISRGQLNIQVA